MKNLGRLILNERVSLLLGHLLSVSIYGLVCSAVLVFAIPGDLDATFGSGGTVFASVTLPDNRVRLQADGKIVTLSNNASGAGAWDYAWIFNQGSAISRHNVDGTLDPTFGNNGTYTSNVNIFINFAIQGDGKFIIVGRNGNDYALHRFNPNGTRDTAFGDDGMVITRFTGFNIASAQGVALLPDGKIITSGWAQSPKGGRIVLVRYHADGTMDTGFGNNGIVIDDNTSTEVLSKMGNEIIVSSTGKLIVSGHIMAQKSSMLIAQYHCDGTRDSGFGTNGIVDTGIEFGYGMVLQTDGKIVVNGFARLSPSFIKRYDSNGAPDPSFGSNGVVSIAEPEPYPQAWGIAQALAIQDDGRILTAGNRSGAFAISRYNPDGNLDATFGTGGVTVTPLSNSSISALALQPDGKIVATGFSSNTSDGHTTLVRYLSDPAAQSFVVSGRVTTPAGLGLRNALVTITDADGSRRTTVTSSLGFYRFEDVDKSKANVMGASSKRYRFESRELGAANDLLEVNFVGIE
jgi:uncharacterized delta-60 repeat protein